MAQWKTAILLILAVMTIPLLPGSVQADSKTPIHGTLPYRTINYPAQEPLNAPAIKPAYKGGDKTEHPDDTQETPEAEITTEIAELAKTLNWSPVSIFEYMKNEIETEWYWGCMKGAEETLRQKSGNDCDQAALLTALLRASGFPTRYVRGTIEFHSPDGIHADRIKNLTNTDDLIKAAEIFQKAGIPYRPVIQGGKITNIQKEHIWVESLIPYSNYRGAIIDGNGRTWLALDSSIKVKGYTYNNPPDIYQNRETEAELATIRQQYLGSTQTKTPIEHLKDRLRGITPNIPPDDYKRTKTLIPSIMKILPNTMQFQQIQITHEYREIPQELKHRVRFITSDPQSTSSSPLFDITMDTMHLTNRKLTITYEPETLEDQQTIEEHGGLDNTPPYLVRLRPVLKVDDERRAVAKDGLQMGQAYTLTIELISPNGTEKITNSQTAGSITSIGLTTPSASYVTQGGDASAITEEDDAETILHKEAIRYIDRWNRSEEELASLLHLNIIRPVPSVVTTGNVMEMTYEQGILQSMKWKGVYMDAAFRAAAPVTRNISPNTEAEKQFMEISALEGSVHEHRIFEDDLKVESISTAKLIQLANMGNLPILQIDRTNITNALPSLDLSEEIMEDITAAVNQGQTVHIPQPLNPSPQSLMHYLDWTGIGYIKEDPKTKEAGYMLSGSIAGGMTALIPASWSWQDIAMRLKNPFTRQSSSGPAAMIRKIRPTDMQTGIVGRKLGRELEVLVQDKDGKPVGDAEVIFSVRAGDGWVDVDYDGNPIRTYTALTEKNGVAKATLYLGKKTGDNPVYMKINPNDEFETQMGLNLVMASTGSISLKQPFNAYAKPDKAVGIEKVLGDGNKAMANNPGGSLLARVVDKHGNPISNIPLTFTALPAESQEPTVPLPSGYRNIEFYTKDACNLLYPVYGECPTVSSISKKTEYFGSAINTMMGNTVNTRYKVNVSALNLQDVVFTLSSTGFRTKDQYIPPGIYMRHMTLLSSSGQLINAAKAGTEPKSPLEARLMLFHDDYSLEKSTCNRKDSNGNPYTIDCWLLKTSGIVRTTPLSSGTVDFAPTQGDGTIISKENKGSGIYSARYRTGPVPTLNLIEATGTATIKVPRVQARSTSSLIPNFMSDVSGIPVEYFGQISVTEYTASDVDCSTSPCSLPLAEVTIPAGQQPIFYGSTVQYAGLAQKEEYKVYGVDVPLTVNPPVVISDDAGFITTDVTLNYNILPDGATNPADIYHSDITDIDLFERDSSNNKLTWIDFFPGDKTEGAGHAIIYAGYKLDTEKEYKLQAVLNRGSDAEIRGNITPLLGIMVDLDADSDNNSAVRADGTEEDPARTDAEEKLEDVAGAPGKVIRVNSTDRDKDGVPDFADGMNLNNNQGPNASAPFIPLILSVKGIGDFSTIKVRFTYPESDPAGIVRTGDITTGFTYTAAPGNLRIWKRDGTQARDASSAKNGGDYIRAGEEYLLSEVGITDKTIPLRLFVEGIAPSASAGDLRVQIDIDPDGDGPLPYQFGDSVRFSAHDSALVPDYNRDRIINEADKKRARAGDKFYFWINDDDDEGETDGSDIPGDKLWNSIYLDHDNGHVDGIRDLIDFFPVHLDIKDLIKIFDPNIYAYRLKSEDESLKFVLTELTSDRTGDYLTGDDKDLKIPLKLGEAATYKINKDGTLLNSHLSMPTFLESTGTQGNGVVIVEGMKESTKPLELVIYENQTEVLSLKLNLNMAEVEKMFRHKNLTPVIYTEVSPGPGSKAGEEDRLDDRVNCPDVECLGADPQNLKNFVYVHGYGNNGQEARGRQVEIFKRMFWSGSRARYYGVTWYGWDSQSLGVTWNFHINVEHAFKTAPYLKAFLNNEVTGEVTIAAHSLGNMIVSSILTDNASEWDASGKIKNFFMTNAAVAAEAYGFADNESEPLSGTHLDMTHPLWQGYKEKLWASEWHTLFDDTDNRKQLTWRNIFKDRPSSVKYYNFFSSGEEVLDIHVGEPNEFDIGMFKQRGRYAWGLQEKLKGVTDANNVLGSNYGGWGFNLGESAYVIEADGYVMPISASQANGIQNLQLKTKPFFRKGNEGMLFDEMAGSNYAAQNRIRLLADAIPARTLAAGKREVPSLLKSESIEEVNFDMQATCKTEKKVNGEYVVYWPSSRGNEDNWRHGDAREVAYSYVFPLFDKIAKLGGLR